MPPALTSYIVEQYVELRAKDSMGQAGRGGKSDQTAMTPRQLLSILRLSQALARIRLAESICEEDVEEAIRLTNASKASLDDDTPTGTQEDPLSTIFRVLSDYAQEHRTRDISYQQAEAMAVSRGFSNQQLRNVLDEYENLQVLRVSADGNTIFFQ